MSSSRPADKRLAAAVLRYLQSGVRSREEALGYLRRRGVSAKEAVSLLRRCESQGFLSDRSAARLWAGHWARQGYAAAAIREKLCARGFDERVSEETIRRWVPASEDENRARSLLSARQHSASGRLRKTRLARALASRGFDEELIERLLEEAGS